jgi:hypothetical protein
MASPQPAAASRAWVAGQVLTFRTRARLSDAADLRADVFAQGLEGMVRPVGVGVCVVSTSAGRCRDHAGCNMLWAGRQSLTG